MKKWFIECPFCKNEIKEGALKCQHCWEFLTKLDDWPFEIKKYKKANRYTVTFLILSIILMFAYIWFFLLFIAINNFTWSLELHKDHLTIKHWLIVKKKEEIPYNKINSVDTTNTLWMVDLNIFVWNDKPTKFRIIEKSNEVVENIRKHIKQ